MVTSLISQRDREFIREHFEKNLVGDVSITLFTERQSALFVPGRQSCEYCEDTRLLLTELAELSDKVRLEVLQFREEPERAKELNVTRIPAIVLDGESRGRVRFFGIPSGYEFSALLQDIVDLSRNETSLSAETRSALGELTEDVHIQVFSTPG